MAALLTGQSVSEIAKQYNIPPQTLRSWKSRQMNGESIVSVATQKKEEIGDLLLDYLRTMLSTLKIQAVHFGDTNWLKDQGANELAVLHGVSTDKAIRLLEALSQDNNES